MLNSIDIMKDHITQILSENKPSIYLFGSVVLNDFRLGWSDIDILCLTKSPITPAQAEQLVNLRQQLLETYPENIYYRSFEGGILSLDEFVSNSPKRVVYWGTRGQRISDKYEFDTFSMMELLDYGQLIYGDDIRPQLNYPTYDELRNAVINHYETIRNYAKVTSRNLYSVGWLLDIARCLYTLQTGKIIAKTAAGDWALNQGLAPNRKVLQTAVDIRKNPIQYKNDASTLDWLETLGDHVQEFADVLEKQLFG